jgi:hypothetical protein
MTDAFLRFTDHTEALAAFEAADLQLDALSYHDTSLPAGMLLVKAVGAAGDGVVYAPTGETETDTEGFEYPAMAAVPGFHVNIRLADGAALPEALADYRFAPQPETPAEIFA